MQTKSEKSTFIIQLFFLYFVISDTQEQLADAKEQLAEKDKLIASQLAELERVNAELAKFKNK